MQVKSHKKAHDEAWTEEHRQSVGSSISRHARDNWATVRRALPKVIEHGEREGIIPPRLQNRRSSSFWGDRLEECIKNADQNLNESGDVIKITGDDISLAHSAIPYLPVPVAITCFILNVLIPGLGTIVSGLSVLCVGQPRLKPTECRLFFSFLLNLIIGLAQLCTVTFLFVGWIWSIAWGSLMIMHSYQYRTALIKQRQEAIAVLAVEAISKDPITHHKQISDFVRQLVSEKTNKKF